MVSSIKSNVLVEVIVFDFIYPFFAGLVVKWFLNSKIIVWYNFCSYTYFVFKKFCNLKKKFLILLRNLLLKVKLILIFFNYYFYIVIKLFIVLNCLKNFSVITFLIFAWNEINTSIYLSATFLYNNFKFRLKSNKHIH